LESSTQNPALAAANTTPKARTIVYWTTTILVAMPIGSGGVSQIAQYLGNQHGVVSVLGYPMYFFAILGFWKALGAIAILAPRFPRLKEWAYAGIFFDLTGAAASCAAVGGYGAYDFHVIAPLILCGFTVASWALRPPSRTLGVLFPAKNGRDSVNTRAANVA
jgi:DoxX-like family